MSETPYSLHLGRPLAREDFTRERAEAYAALLKQNGTALDTDAREASRRAFLQGLPPGEDLWVFGYGSLMWNPALRQIDSRIARIEGYVRRFCLTMAWGRGTPERPGLMLGLDAQAGGRCTGVVLRIAASDIESESQVLWYREMLSGVYQPRRLEADIEGLARMKVLAFVIDRSHARYEGVVPFDEQVQRLAFAEGFLGTSRDYLYETAKFLKDRGLEDDGLGALAAAVRVRHAEQESGK